MDNPIFIRIGQIKKSPNVRADTQEETQKI